METITLTGWKLLAPYEKIFRMSHLVVGHHYCSYGKEVRVGQQRGPEVSFNARYLGTKVRGIRLGRVKAGRPSFYLDFSECSPREKPDTRAEHYWTEWWRIHLPAPRPYEEQLSHAISWCLRQEELAKAVSDFLDGGPTPTPVRTHPDQSDDPFVVRPAINDLPHELSLGDLYELHAERRDRFYRRRGRQQRRESRSLADEMDEYARAYSGLWLDNLRRNFRE